MSVMGIDIGTSGCKVMVVASDGSVLAKVQDVYSISNPRKNFYELDPQEVWYKIKASIRKANKRICKDPVESLSVSSQGEAVIPLDSETNNLALCPISSDMRGAELIPLLHKKIGAQEIFRKTGQIIEPIHSIFKIYWWKNNLPDLDEKCWKYICFDTFIYIKMGLPPVTDQTMAARTMLYDINSKAWSKELMEIIGIEEKQLPEVLRTGSAIGELSSNVAEELGFQGHPKAVAGGHDQPCSSLGAGIVSEGISYSIGTTECISVISKDRIFDETLNIPAYPHVCNDKYVHLIGSQTGVRFFTWLGGLFYEPYDMDIENDGIQQKIFSYVKSVSPSIRTNVVVIPHLTGSGLFYNNPNSEGLIYGLKLHTKREELLKASLEGITVEQFLSFERMKKKHIMNGNEMIMYAIGGGSTFYNWLQIKADIFKMKIRKITYHDAACIGAVILAGVGTGVFSSVDDAVRKCVSFENEIIPDLAMEHYYSNKIKHYNILYYSVHNRGEECE